MRSCRRCVDCTNSRPCACAIDDPEAGASCPNDEPVDRVHESAEPSDPLARLLTTAQAIEGLRDLFAAEEPLDDVARAGRRDRARRDPACGRHQHHGAVVA